ncbi:hypothetical protein KRE47_05305 [Elizabethkingia meningoseptica]|uniref:hypothetical protein n=1 Tax=Elizabethkingia meningoseptica TaxID=238 RepID=UPI0023B1719E|nr:hypothetical protein [Elizabethkingia meningoseptica]MDE5467448.1 hypothetical protein [Elizabethkingia meningoseptica]MDE5474367.1 hypothetical protein [Elizabethkingia meningoseptica]MDE5477800.1 hypothetical protein [Elizabethkingia meningoseptica]MDE5485707.1 hypothetical protein [Elizabethkingia meningoseptica]MDE5502209.1 hypothetical protein [Elizabethkingia meningoseptica]
MKKLSRKNQKNILGQGNNCPDGLYEAPFKGQVICCVQVPFTTDLCDPRMSIYCDMPYDICGEIQ